MVATDTTISRPCRPHQLRQLAPGRLRERHAHVHADEERDGQLVGERDERELHRLAPDRGRVRTIGHHPAASLCPALTDSTRALAPRARATRRRTRAPPGATADGPDLEVPAGRSCDLGPCFTLMGAFQQWPLADGAPGILVGTDSGSTRRSEGARWTQRRRRPSEMPPPDTVGIAVAAPLDPRLLRYAKTTRRFVVLAVAVGGVTALLVVAQAFLIATVVGGGLRRPPLRRLAAHPLGRPARGGGRSSRPGLGHRTCGAPGVGIGQVGAAARRDEPRRRARPTGPRRPQRGSAQRRS